MNVAFNLELSLLWKTALTCLHVCHSRSTNAAFALCREMGNICYLLFKTAQQFSWVCETSKSGHTNIRDSIGMRRKVITSLTKESWLVLSDCLALSTWRESMSHKIRKSHVICIKMILQRNPFACLDEHFLCSVKQTKIVFLEADFYELWRKETVDAFIKYGNLLNGLWQSHWRSLFRCRWLPPRLLLLPVGKMRGKNTSCFPLSDSQSHELSVCIWDRLTALPPSRGSLQIHSPLKHQKNRM